MMKFYSPTAAPEAPLADGISLSGVHFAQSAVTPYTVGGRAGGGVKREEEFKSLFIKNTSCFKYYSQNAVLFKDIFFEKNH